MCQGFVLIYNVCLFYFHFLIWKKIKVKSRFIYMRKNTIINSFFTTLSSPTMYCKNILYLYLQCSVLGPSSRSWARILVTAGINFPQTDPTRTGTWNLLTVKAKVLATQPPMLTFLLFVLIPWGSSWSKSLQKIHKITLRIVTRI